jgi:hypothetical protein
MFHSGVQQTGGGTVRAPLESPAQLAVIGLGVWLVGVLIHPLALLSPIGLVLLLVAAMGYILRPRSHSMYWRGRRIDLEDETRVTDGLYRKVFRR